MKTNTEVVILGGGLAGLSLARQLKLTMPDIDIVVLEKNSFPLSEAAVKVGESTVEMGAHYYANILKMKKHLEKEQFFKLGLRYFFPYNNNEDITQRFEMGSAQLPTPVPTYQIDRGRFENALYDINKINGITILENCKVQNVILSENKQSQHDIIYFDGQNQKTIQATWVVDATGRFGFLRKKLSLHVPVKHDSCAAWFRIQTVIDVTEWSDDPQWLARAPLGQRYMSTNHLMGTGYWVWLIPLASGSTSIGVVYDPKIHDNSNFKDFEGTLIWLNKHEPQCAKHIDKHRDKLQDFRFLKQYAHSCTELYSNNRWFLTGEAGVFADPFYSPGSDFIALGNTYITDLIKRDRNQECIASRIVCYNKTLLTYFDLLLSHFEGHYQNFDCAYLMVQKILWDTICAFAIPYLLFFTQKFCDLNFMQQTGLPALMRYQTLTYQVQAYFKKNNAVYKKIKLEKAFLNFSDIIHSNYFNGSIYRQLQRYYKYNNAALKIEIEKNIFLIEKIAHDILTNKAIIPLFFLENEGNDSELWKITKSQLTLAVQNGW
ncbi:MAG: tryptophan 7-halogenase [Pseudomonadota bacterium]